MTTWENLARLLQFVGLLIVVIGLWFSARGMRVVVSGRIDERRRSASSLKLGIPLLIAGVLLLVGGAMLGNWAMLP
ncbi:MAG TPA: hypothetical protein VJ828_04985 [Lacipirellulaceae bacterium]|nr:hypothetical protein [Lacipirellulaceae bacterium]